MSVLGPALALAVGLVLTVAGLAHVRRPAALTAAVSAHRVLPAAAVPPLVLGAVEALLGTALAVTAVTGAVEGTRILAGAATLLLASMSVYLVAARRRQLASGAPDLPCGCGVGEAPLSGAVVARSLGLALAAGTAAVVASSWSLVERPAAEGVVTASAGITLAVVLALLPAARIATGGPAEAVGR